MINFAIIFHDITCGMFFPGLVIEFNTTGGNMIAACCEDDGRVRFDRGFKDSFFTSHIFLQPVAAPFILAPLFDFLVLKSASCFVFSSGTL